MITWQELNQNNDTGVGPAGANGVDGKTVRSGSGAPSSGLGVDGDFYINTSANTIYGPKSSGSWGSATSIVGPQGVAGTPASLTLNPIIPTRSLNTAFQPSTTKMVRAGYDVDVTCSLSLSGGTEGRVRLLSDANNPPTTVRRTKSNGNSGALTIGLNLVQKITLGLDYDVPPGHYVKIETTNTTGTPTFALVGQSEEELSPT